METAAIFGGVGRCIKVSAVAISFVAVGEVGKVLPELLSIVLA